MKHSTIDVGLENVKYKLPHRLALHLAFFIVVFLYRSLKVVHAQIHSSFFSVFCLFVMKRDWIISFRFNYIINTINISSNFYCLVALI